MKNYADQCEQNSAVKASCSVIEAALLQAIKKIVPELAEWMISTNYEVEIYPPAT